MYILPTVLARGTLFYLAAVNGGAVGLFAYDKHQASNGGWRVSEQTLCNTAMMGGWMGGLLAMQLFRHKTQKKSFQKKYLAAIGTNTVVAAPVVLVGSRVPAFRTQFQISFRQLTSAFGRYGRGYRVPKKGGGRKPPSGRR